MDPAACNHLRNVLAGARSRRTALRLGSTGLALGALSRAVNSTRAQDATPSAPPSIDVATVDERLKQAFITGDRALLKALYAPDAVLISPFGVFHGSAEISRYIDQFFAANPGLQVSFGETTVILNTAVHRAIVTSDPIHQAGVERIVLIHTVVIEQDHIVSLTARLDQSDDQTRRYTTALMGSPPAGTPAP